MYRKVPSITLTCWECFPDLFPESQVVHERLVYFHILLYFFFRYRGLHEMTLPDQEIGVALFDGQMSGLTNLSRRGDALLEAETDHFLLTFALQAKDLRCAYGWRKQRLK